VRQRELAAELERYLEWLEVRGYTPSTVRSRRQLLGVLVRWCDERGVTRPPELTREVVERYQRWTARQRGRGGQRLSLRTQHQRLVAVRGFGRWLAQQRVLLYNPASELELPRLGDPLPQAVLTAAEAEQVMTTPDLAAPLGLRDRAVLEVLYSTGMRRSEAVRLRVRDVDFVRGVVTVRHGKGRRDRVVPIGERALAWLRAYLERVRPTLARPPDHGVVFLSVAGRPFAPNGMSDLVSRLVAASGVDKEGSCHLLRHTMATLMLEGGADIRYIQEMLGHVKLDTTQVYTRVSIGRLKAVHDATHPAAKLERRSSKTEQLQELTEPRILLDEEAGGPLVN